MYRLSLLTLFYLQANPKDIDQLNSAIEYRLREITKRIKISHDDVANVPEEEEGVSTADSI